MSIQVIKKPVISEKSVSEAEDRNIYLFEVNPKANKHQISAQVKLLFEVDVLSVRTLTRPAKKKRYGRARRVRVTSPKKYAFVHIKKGQKIPVFEIVQS